jgi:signal-induced proliferation-associated 1 like protein 3
VPIELLPEVPVPMLPLPMVPLAPDVPVPVPVLEEPLVLVSPMLEPLVELPELVEPLLLEPELLLCFFVCFFLLDFLAGDLLVAWSAWALALVSPVVEALLLCAWALPIPNIAIATDAPSRPFSNLFIFMSLS